MLEIKGISARLGNFELKYISLVVEPGDYLTVLGLSGAGKTVLLEILAGLVSPHKGNIFLHGKDITRQSIQKRPLGLVYQDMALFPHMNVRKNIAYPLKGRIPDPRERNNRIEALARMAQVEHLLDRYPGTLSGGEAQRVALARTLASDPEILLLDEPLASLDVKLRQELRELLKKINQSGKTIIHVTHDPMEAATLSKKIAIIEKGELIQWGEPHEVFRNPVSEFVARFSGIKNIFPCHINPNPENHDLSIGQTDSGFRIRFMENTGKDFAHLMIPGEDIFLSEEELTSSAINQYTGVIKEIYSIHHGVEVVIHSGGEDFSVIITRKSLEKLELAPGKNIWFSFKASAVKVL